MTQAGAHDDLTERLKFAGVTDDVRQSLGEVWVLAKPHLPEIMKRFYGKMKQIPHLAAMIGEQQARLEKAQEQHWGRLFSGRFDADYAASVTKIGMTHHRIGLEPRWYIGGYKFVLSELVDVILKANRMRPSRASTQIAALNTAVMLDLDFAISVYQDVLIAERAKRGEFMEATFSSFKIAVEALLGTVDENNRGLQRTADQLASIAGDASHQAVAAASASEETSTTVQTVAASAEELTSSIQEIGRQLDSATHVVQEARAKTTQSSAAVEGLAVSGQKIGDVISLIQAIAGQTNLLALNATIEAARAGEAGRGFAVVAAEVKELAGQTAKATEEISRQVTDIQSGTGRAVQAIESIAAIMSQVDQVTASIASAVEEQGAATREIASNIQMAAAGTTTLSESIGSVEAAIGSTSQSAATVRMASQALGKQSGALSDEVRNFLRTLREGPLDRREGEDPNYHGRERRAS